MITSLRLLNFKSFANESLRLGPLTVIVGANASGKSNICDAFRFLHAIGRGYSLPEVLGGRIGAGGQVDWPGIRGAPHELARLKAGSMAPNFLASFGIQIEFQLNGEEVHYSINVGIDPNHPAKYVVLAEKLRSGSWTIFETIDKNESGHWIKFWKSANDEFPVQLGFDRSKPALTQFQGHLKSAWYRTLEPIGIHGALENMRFVDFSLDRLRESSFPGAVALGDAGQNLPATLEEICANSKRGKDTLTSWLREITPMEVVDFKFPRDPDGRTHLKLVEESGIEISVHSASDGTLRFLALLAILLGPNPGGFYFFEEIDTGIHPARSAQLLELIERQTCQSAVQIATTTHQSNLLEWASDETFSNTSVVFRDEGESFSVVRPLAALPNATKLRNTQGFGHLHPTGWIENALALSEEKGESQQARF
jgi:predicted ATPase